VRLCTFSRNGREPAVGILVSRDRIADFQEVALSLGVELPKLGTLRDVVRAGATLWQALRDLEAAVEEAKDLVAGVLPVSDVHLHFPYRPRGNIVKAGGNSRSINGFPNPEAVSLLRYHTKAPTACADPGASVTWRTSVTQQVYAEPQLAIVVGAPLYFATPDEAKDAVFGYATSTDFRAWDLMQKHGQWPKPVSLDGFFPWGPYIVTTDEVADADVLEVQLELNGEIVVAGSTSDVLLSIGGMLAELSRGIRIEPGDVFLLGVPEAVGFGKDPARWCRDGDVIVSSIEGLGQIGVEVRIQVT
jgi:2-keto-4-pentenoate hydratase/2-oxohepta-3-ene-1,7-dioic acid hydratase in catechol pathway